MTDNIIDFNDAKKEKEQKVIASLPRSAVEYLEVRAIQASKIKELREMLKVFEGTMLCFSKKSQLTGPKIDQYVTSIISIQISEENMRVNDEIMKKSFPGINIPE